MLGRRPRPSVTTAAAAVLVTTLLAVPAVGEEPSAFVVPDTAAEDGTDTRADDYVVVLADAPVATYDGDVRGYAATRDIDPDSPQARRYERFLERRVDGALRRNGIDAGAKDEQFTQAVTGFTAELSSAQAERLRSDDNVLTVAHDEIRQPTTDTTPAFLGLTDRRDGLWTRRGLLGEDVVIGVIDSGIRPESASFADDGSFAPLSDWDGDCDPGEDDSFTCDPTNDKLVGARYFVDGFGGPARIRAQFPEEFLSPLDADGHGTHTASTAGGNADVRTPFGWISGIAPRARIAAYKVCWGSGGGGGCATSDSVAAIDQAVTDGVDVINYSISGTTSNYLDPVELAFLFAADAGVVVNASAGNGGPAASSVNHPSPWITTVGAGTESQQFAGAVTIGGELPGECASMPVTARLSRRSANYEAQGSGVVDRAVTVTVTRTAAGEERIRVRNARKPARPATTLARQGVAVDLVVPAARGDRLVVQERTRRGWVPVARFEAVDCAGGDDVDDDQTFAGAPSIGNPGTGPLPLVYGGDVGVEGASAADAARCFDATLDPALVAGATVLCDRGVSDRVAKSAAVAAAGGAAMILGNTGPNSLNADTHGVPTTHVDQDAAAAIKQYIGSTDVPVARQAPATTVTEVAPDVAFFSARGPLADDGDLLKPDIIAPGRDVLAASSPAGGGRDFDYQSGTSMSSPHAAGLSALLVEAHPAWSPAAVRSALMTTATQTRTDGSPIDGGPFAYGSGHVSPNDAFDPSLVYDAAFSDYVDFLCGVGAVSCLGFSFDPSDLNQPNIAIGELVGQQTVTRTVTNVTGRRISFLADVDAPDGIDVAVSPRLLTIPAGGRASYDVTFTSERDAVLGEPTFGELTWRAGGGRAVTSQLVVTPEQFDAPVEVVGRGQQGTIDYEISLGYRGPFSAAAHGLVPGRLRGGSVANDPGQDVNRALQTGVGVRFHTVSVPPGVAHARVALFDEYTDGADDLDLYLFAPDTTYLGGSATDGSVEQVDLVRPPPGNYTAIVHGWRTDGPSANYALFDWSVRTNPSEDNGSLTVEAPSAAVIGDKPEVTVRWSGLAPGRKYLGAVSYSDGTQIGITLVNVQTD